MHETFASFGWYCPAAHAVHAVTSPPAETYLPRRYSEYSQRVLGVLTKGTRSTHKGYSHRCFHGLLGALSKGPPLCRRPAQLARRPLHIHALVRERVCVCARARALLRECVSIHAEQRRGTRSTHARVPEGVLGVLTPRRTARTAPRVPAPTWPGAGPACSRAARTRRRPCSRRVCCTCECRVSTLTTRCGYSEYPM
jgi:hypothetical protein